MVESKRNKTGTIKIQTYASIKDWHGWNWVGFKRSAKEAQKVAEIYYLNRFQPMRITKSKEKGAYDIWIFKGNK